MHRYASSDDHAHGRYCCCTFVWLALLFLTRYDQTLPRYKEVWLAVPKIGDVANSFAARQQLNPLFVGVDVDCGAYCLTST